MTIHKINKFTSLLLVVLSGLALVFSAIPATKTASADSNIATWVLCKTDDGKALYNAATTDVIPYNLRSKSNGATTDDIDSFLNMILTTSGFDFDKVNKAILGRPVTPDADKIVDDKDKDNNKPAKETDYNKKAPRVNPFDRFGVAGLNWSSYQGEWKYYDVNGCSADDNVGKTEFGKFYKERKEPRTTYDGISNSADPRTEQFSRGTVTAWASAFNDLLSNFVFSITKAIVAFTVAMISFAFVDITDVIGLSGATGGFQGMFNNLYSGVFQPLLALMMVLTAFYVLYNGLVKRQIREALVNGLGASLLCILFAAIIAGKPSYWIPFPNRVATYGEALVVNALSQGERGGEGWCDTNVSDTKKRTITVEGSVEQQQQQLSKVGEDMRSVIGCRMWEEFLLRPWSQGQFGANYTELDAKKVKNHNSKWVGEPAVPLGGGKVVKNWALFQLSTQTTAHSQLGEDGKLTQDPTKNVISRVDDVSTDWFRTVDALSNYDEKDSKLIQTADFSGKNMSDNQITNLKPSQYWQDWIGNHTSQRYGTAFLSVIFAGLGSIGPLVFAFMAAIYSVGVTLLMAISPVFLLLGCWAGNGSQIFRGWLASLLEFMVKKIVATAMILLSFIVVMSSMDLVNKIGWIKATTLMLIMTLVMLKSRRQIFDIFARFNFGTTFSPTRKVGAVIHKMTSKVDDVALAGGGVAYGAIKGHKAGIGAANGAKYAASEQADLLMRRSTIGRQMLLQRDSMSNNDLDEDIHCMKCGTQIKPGDMSYRTESGLYYCFTCGEEMGGDNMYEVKIPKSVENPNSRSMRARARNLRSLNLTERHKPNDGTKPEHPKDRPRVNRDKGTRNKSWLSYGRVQKRLGIRDDGDDNYSWNDNSVQNMVTSNLVNLESDIDDYEVAYREVGNNAQPPATPEPLKEYLDPTIMSAAWRSGRYTVVRDSYKQAWKNWYEDNAKVINVSDESKKQFNQAVSDFDGQNFSRNGQSETEPKNPIAEEPETPNDPTDNSTPSETHDNSKPAVNPDNKPTNKPKPKKSKPKDLSDEEIRAEVDRNKEARRRFLTKRVKERREHDNTPPEATGGDVSHSTPHEVKLHSEELKADSEHDIGNPDAGGKE